MRRFDLDHACVEAERNVAHVYKYPLLSKCTIDFFPGAMSNIIFQYARCCRVTYWRLVYFIDDNGKLLNSHLQQPLDVAALTNAFNVQIAGSSKSYSELLVTTTVVTVRVSELFTVVFEQKVSRRDFAAMSASIVNAWKQIHPGEHHGHL